MKSKLGNYFEPSNSSFIVMFLRIEHMLGLWFILCGAHGAFFLRVHTLVVLTTASLYKKCHLCWQCQQVFLNTKSLRSTPMIHSPKSIHKSRYLFSTLPPFMWTDWGTRSGERQVPSQIIYLSHELMRTASIIYRGIFYYSIIRFVWDVDYYPGPNKKK